MKTVFKLEHSNLMPAGWTASIIGTAPKNKPYVVLEESQGSASIFIPDKELERFAVNILKALKSKKLKTP